MSKVQKDPKLAKEPRRIWKGGPIRLMSKAEGYVMVRRPYAMAFVMCEKEWNALPIEGAQG